MPPRFSIPIATYRRPAWLRRAVQSVLDQDYPAADYEVLVVDNNSGDETPRVLEPWLATGRVRYFLETAPGVSHARNRGWREARGEYIGYIDDDCKVPRDWLRRADEIVRAHSPAMFGGPYYAFYEEEKPAWFRDEYGSNIQAAGTGPMAAHEFLDGGNLFIRRELIADLGGFDPDLGHKSGRVGYQEEPLLQKELMRKHPEAVRYFCPELFVYHLVRPEVMSPWWRLRSAFAHGRFGFRARLQDLGAARAARASWRTAAGALMGLAWALGPGLPLRDRARFPAWQNHVWERAGTHVRVLGNIYEYIFGKRPAPTRPPRGPGSS